MSSDRARKRAIRARMAETGELYTVAARALDAVHQPGLVSLDPAPPVPVADPDPGAPPIDLHGGGRYAVTVDQIAARRVLGDPPHVRSTREVRLIERAVRSLGPRSRTLLMLAPAGDSELADLHGHHRGGRSDASPARRDLGRPRGLRRELAAVTTSAGTPAPYQCECCELPSVWKKARGWGYVCDECLNHHYAIAGGPAEPPAEAVEAEHELRRLAWQARVRDLSAGPTPRDPDPEVDAVRACWMGRTIAHHDRHGPHWWGADPHRVVDVVRFGDRVEVHITPADGTEGGGLVGLDYLEDWEDVEVGESEQPKDLSPGWTHYCDPPTRVTNVNDKGREVALSPGEAWPCACGRWYGVADTHGRPARWVRLILDATIHMGGLRQ